MISTTNWGWFGPCQIWLHSRKSSNSTFWQSKLGVGHPMSNGKNYMNPQVPDFPWSGCISQGFSYLPAAFQGSGWLDPGQAQFAGQGLRVQGWPRWVGDWGWNHAREWPEIHELASRPRIGVGSLGLSRVGQQHLLGKARMLAQTSSERCGRGIRSSVRFRRCRCDDPWLGQQKLGFKSFLHVSFVGIGSWMLQPSATWWRWNLQLLSGGLPVRACVGLHWPPSP